VTCLLDGNVLIALVAPTHVHHEAAHRWRAGAGSGDFATCPVTQGTLVRLAVQQGATTGAALSALATVSAHPGHQFWADDVSYLAIDLTRVIGHRQVTDAYLAGLARSHAGRLATFDAGLAATHPDVAELVPVDHR
jgi:toxin-antitoxin system PIN domain toxin